MSFSPFQNSRLHSELPLLTGLRSCCCFACVIHSRSTIRKAFLYKCVCVSVRIMCSFVRFCMYLSMYLSMHLSIYVVFPVVPARGGAEVALDLIIRPFSSIELARIVRRACLLRANLLRCCWPRTWPACDHCGAQHHETCTAHLPPDLMSNHLISSDICPLTSTHPIFPTHRQPDSFSFLQHI